jgi:DNA-binding transcriptional LysR family regulator
MSTSSTTPQLLNRLRMRQVALMLAIDERKTLRAAAAHLGMAQPTASKMLHELEGALGEALFDRVGRGLKLNPAGEAVMNSFRSLRNTVTALGRELKELRLGSTGKLFIGSITVAAPTDLGDAMIALKKQYPLLSIELFVDTSDRLIELLRAGSLDVVIGRMPEAGNPANQDCLFHPIAEEALSVVAAPSHPLSRAGRRKRLDFAALLDFPWVLQLRGSPLREVIEQEFRSHHAPLPQGLIETSSIVTATDLVSQSDMIAIIPHSFAKRYEKDGYLRILPYAMTHTLTAWGSLVLRERTINPITRRFLDLLHGEGSA